MGGKVGVKGSAVLTAKALANQVTCLPHVPPCPPHPTPPTRMTVPSLLSAVSLGLGEP